MRRITLTLDDQIASSLQERAHRNQQTITEVVNQALSLGLEAMDQPRPAARYRLKAVSMGRLRGSVDIDGALALANQLEDDAISSAR